MGVEETNFAHWYGNYTYSDDVKVLHCHGWKLPDILTHLDTIANQGVGSCGQSLWSGPAIADMIFDCRRLPLERQGGS